MSDSVPDPVPASLPAPSALDFVAVPRRRPRHDGWTPERQRAFVAALADTGCVAVAARMVNMTPESAYMLRRQPGAEGFRRAWEAAQGLGLQVVKDEAFDRAMNGQLVPVFVGGKLMGFRRKKNERLLMFILRHYGQDAAGRRTTINYFSTRATAAAGAGAPSGRRPTRSDAPTSARDAGSGRPATGEAVSFDVTDSLRDDAPSFAAAEASTTTVKTIISGTPGQDNPLARLDDAAALLASFEGVALDEKARAEVYRTLEACAERRRALAETPEDDPARAYLGADERGLYLGELELGAERDFVAYRPEACPEQNRGSEHRWESLGQGGDAAEIDRVVAEVRESIAAKTPEQREAERALSLAAIEETCRKQALPPGFQGEPDPDDPMLDCRNWSEAGYRPPSEASSPSMGEEGGGGGAAAAPPPEGRALLRRPASAKVGSASETAAGAPGPDPGPSPQKRLYRKRQPKPRFTPAEAGSETYEARKAAATAETAATKRANAGAEMLRRKRRKRAKT